MNKKEYVWVISSDKAHGWLCNTKNGCAFFYFNKGIVDGKEKINYKLNQWGSEYQDFNGTFEEFKEFAEAFVKKMKL